jgi:alpha-1,4-digalacturonate transport system substrate-binding protein
MYYNKTIFDKAGIKAPATSEEAWTWDEFIENVKTAQKKTGIKYGFASDFSRARYDTIMYAFGGSLVKKSGDAFVINANSKENVEALTMFKGLNDDGTMPKAIWAGATSDNPGDYFANGDAAVLLSGSWKYQGFKDNIKSFEWGTMATPKKLSSAAIIGGSALAVAEKGKNKELAQEFIKWFYTDKNFQNYINSDKGPSSLKAVTYSPDNDFDKANLTVIQNEVSYVPEAFMIDESSSWRTYLDNEYRDDLKQAVAGTMTPQEALDDFATRLSQKSGWEIAK